METTSPHVGGLNAFNINPLDNITNNLEKSESPFSLSSATTGPANCEFVIDSANYDNLVNQLKEHLKIKKEKFDKDSVARDAEQFQMLHNEINKISADLQAIGKELEVPVPNKVGAQKSAPVGLYGIPILNGGGDDEKLGQIAQNLQTVYVGVNSIIGKVTNIRNTMKQNTFSRKLGFVDLDMIGQHKVRGLLRRSPKLSSPRNTNQNVPNATLSAVDPVGKRYLILFDGKKTPEIVTKLCKE